MKLSDHFTLEEMTRNSHGMDNAPNAMQIAKLEELCLGVLEPVRKHFNKPVIVKSGFRSEALNMVVGGASTSQHLKGEAADIEISGVANAEIWNFIFHHLSFDQLIAEYLNEDDGSAGWVHVSYKISKNRREALSCVARGKYLKGLVFA